MTAWLEELNPAQRRAVTHGDGPLLIIAGAGTGKTKTLACRVAHLIHQGVAPDSILLLTFTRRAAAEMIKRARLISEQTTGANVWGGTFHAVANRLLRIYARSVNLPPDFTVMDQGDAADVMNLIRNELGLAKGKRRFPRKATLVKIYSHTVNAQKPLNETLESYFPWCLDDMEPMGRIFEQYLQRKRQNHVLDYDDLLLYWQMLTTAAGVGDKVADRFEHILVDEYQDTNSVQAQILRGMRKKYDNIVVVGDDAQSIYAFRAATIRNILDFPEHFPDATTVTLEQNYRSTEPILAASNAVMEQARERYTKELWSHRRSEQKPILIHCAEESDQTDSVCRNILTHLEEGIPLIQQAVLFRAGHHSADLEVELTKRNIPFHKFGGLRFIEAAHIKDMLAFLRIIENPYDQMSWFRVLQLLDGIGPRTAQRIMDALITGAEASTAGDRDQGDGGDDPANPIRGTARAEARGSLQTPLGRLFTDPPAVPSAAREQFAAMRIALADCSGMSLDDSSPPTRGGATARSTDGGRRKTKTPAKKAKTSANKAKTSANKAKTSAKKSPVTLQIERITRFYKPILKRIYENSPARLRDLEQLEHIASRYRSRSRFITDLTLDPPASTADLAGKPFLEEDYLTLSTIHSAKGCEWTVVHIIHAADGMIPSDMAVGDEAGVDEERRLFYVAMTRAKDFLYAYFPLRYYHRRFNLGDGHTYAQLTRFISSPVRALFEERSTAGSQEGDGDAVDSHKPVDMEDLNARLNRLWNN